jgi:hypothetical protein
MTRTQPWESEEQRERWRQAAALEEADRPRHEARLRQLSDAARAPGFAGELRRAVLESRRPWPALATEIGVEPQAVFDWMAGDAELSGAATAALVDALGLHLAAVPL